MIDACVRIGRIAVDNCQMERADVWFHLLFALAVGPIVFALMGGALLA